MNDLVDAFHYGVRAYCSWAESCWIPDDAYDVFGVYGL